MEETEENSESGPILKTDDISNSPGKSCALCGCSTPAVRCDRCSSQIFCLSCDDMYHRHPKRKLHLRKAVDSIWNTARSPRLRRRTDLPGDPSKIPIPPPRSKKRERHTKGGRLFLKPTHELGSFGHSKIDIRNIPKPSNDVFAGLKTPTSIEGTYENDGDFQTRNVESVTKSEEIYENENVPINPGENVDNSNSVSRSPWNLTRTNISSPIQVSIPSSSPDLIANGQPFGYPTKQSRSIADLSGAPPTGFGHHPYHLPHYPYMHPPIHPPYSHSMAHLNCAQCLSSSWSNLMSPHPSPYFHPMPWGSAQGSLARGHPPPTSNGNMKHSHGDLPSYPDPNFHYPYPGGPYFANGVPTVDPAFVRDLHQHSLDTTSVKKSPSGSRHALSTEDMEIATDTAPDVATDADERNVESGSVNQEDPDEAPIIPETPTEPWSCMHCTFINPPGSYICQVCCKTSYGNKRSNTQKEVRPTDIRNSESPAELVNLDAMSPASDFLKHKEVQKAEDSIGEDSLENENLSEEKLNDNIPETPEPSIMLTTETQTSTSVKSTDVQTQNLICQTVASSTDSIFPKHEISVQTEEEPVIKNCSVATDPMISSQSMESLMSGVSAPPYHNRRAGWGRGASFSTQSLYERGRSRSPLPRSLSHEAHSFGRDSSLPPEEVMHSWSQAWLMSDPMYYKPHNLPGFGQTLVKEDYFDGTWGSMDKLNRRVKSRKGNKDEALQRPRFHRSLDDLKAEKNQDLFHSRELQFLQTVKEAERCGFSLEDLHVAYLHCGKENPVFWLEDNWSSMIKNVIALAAKYGEDNEENDVGVISSSEAKEALHIHRGDIWDAVTECIENRQRKILELTVRGNFTQKQIADALKNNNGNVELAYADLLRASSKRHKFILSPGMSEESEDLPLFNAAEESTIEHGVRASPLRAAKLDLLPEAKVDKKKSDFLTKLSSIRKAQSERRKAREEKEMIRESITQESQDSLPTDIVSPQSDEDKSLKTTLSPQISDAKPLPDEIEDINETEIEIDLHLKDVDEKKDGTEDNIPENYDTNWVESQGEWIEEYSDEQWDEEGDGQWVSLQKKYEKMEKEFEEEAREMAALWEKEELEDDVFEEESKDILHQTIDSEAERLKAEQEEKFQQWVKINLEKSLSEPEDAEASEPALTSDLVAVTALSKSMEFDTDIRDSPLQHYPTEYDLSSKLEDPDWIDIETSIDKQLAEAAPEIKEVAGIENAPEPSMHEFKDTNVYDQELSEGEWEKIDYEAELLELNEDEVMKASKVSREFSPEISLSKLQFEEERERAEFLKEELLANIESESGTLPVMESTFLSSDISEEKLVSSPKEKSPDSTIKEKSPDVSHPRPPLRRKSKLSASAIEEVLRNQPLDDSIPPALPVKRNKNSETFDVYAVPDKHKTKGVKEDLSVSLPKSPEIARKLPTEEQSTEAFPLKPPRLNLSTTRKSDSSETDNKKLLTVTRSKDGSPATSISNESDSNCFADSESDPEIRTIRQKYMHRKPAKYENEEDDMFEDTVSGFKQEDSNKNVPQHAVDLHSETIQSMLREEFDFGPELPTPIGSRGCRVTETEVVSPKAFREGTARPLQLFKASPAASFEEKDVGATSCEPETAHKEHEIKAETSRPLLEQTIKPPASNTEITLEKSEYSEAQLAPLEMSDTFYYNSATELNQESQQVLNVSAASTKASDVQYYNTVVTEPISKPNEIQGVELYQQSAESYPEQKNVLQQQSIPEEPVQMLESGPSVTQDELAFIEMESASAADYFFGRYNEVTVTKPKKKTPVVKASKPTATVVGPKMSASQVTVTASATSPSQMTVSASPISFTAIDSPSSVSSQQPLNITQELMPEKKPTPETKPVSIPKPSPEPIPEESLSFAEDYFFGSNNKVVVPKKVMIKPISVIPKPKSLEKPKTLEKRPLEVVSTDKTPDLESEIEPVFSDATQGALSASTPSGSLESIDESFYDACTFNGDEFILASSSQQPTENIQIDTSNNDRKLDSKGKSVHFEEPQPVIVPPPRKNRQKLESNRSSVSSYASAADDYSYHQYGASSQFVELDKKKLQPYSEDFKMNQGCDPSDFPSDSLSLPSEMQESGTSSEISLYDKDSFNLPESYPKNDSFYDRTTRKPSDDFEFLEIPTSMDHGIDSETSAVTEMSKISLQNTFTVEYTDQSDHISSSSEDKREFVKEQISSNVSKSATAGVADESMEEAMYISENKDELKEYSEIPENNAVVTGESQAQPAIFDSVFQSDPPHISKEDHEDSDSLQIDNDFDDELHLVEETQNLINEFCDSNFLESFEITPNEMKCLNTKNNQDLSYDSEQEWKMNEERNNSLNATFIDNKLYNTDLSANQNIVDENNSFIIDTNPDDPECDSIPGILRDDFELSDINEANELAVGSAENVGTSTITEFSPEKDSENVIKPLSVLCQAAASTFESIAFSLQNISLSSEEDISLDILQNTEDKDHEPGYSLLESLDTLNEQSDDSLVTSTHSSISTQIAVSSDIKIQDLDEEINLSEKTTDVIAEDFVVEEDVISMSVTGVEKGSFDESNTDLEYICSSETETTLQSFQNQEPIKCESNNLESLSSIQYDNGSVIDQTDETSKVESVIESNNLSDGINVSQCDELLSKTNESDKIFPKETMTEPVAIEKEILWLTEKVEVVEEENNMLKKPSSDDFAIEKKLIKNEDYETDGTKYDIDKVEKGLNASSIHEKYTGNLQDSLCETKTATEDDVTVKKISPDSFVTEKCDNSEKSGALTDVENYGISVEDTDSETVIEVHDESYETSMKDDDYLEESNEESFGSLMSHFYDEWIENVKTTATMTTLQQDVRNLYATYDYSGSSAGNSGNVSENEEVCESSLVKPSDSVIPSTKSDETKDIIKSIEVVSESETYEQESNTTAMEPILSIEDETETLLPIIADDTTGKICKESVKSFELEDAIEHFDQELSRQTISCTEVEVSKTVTPNNDLNNIHLKNKKISTSKSCQTDDSFEEDQFFDSFDDGFTDPSLLYFQLNKSINIEPTKIEIGVQCCLVDTEMVSPSLDSSDIRKVCDKPKIDISPALEETSIEDWFEEPPEDIQNPVMDDSIPFSDSASKTSESASEATEDSDSDLFLEPHSSHEELADGRRNSKSRCQFLFAEVDSDTGFSSGSEYGIQTKKSYSEGSSTKYEKKQAVHGSTKNEISASQETEFCAESINKNDQKTSALSLEPYTTENSFVPSESPKVQKDISQEMPEKRSDKTVHSDADGSYNQPEDYLDRAVTPIAIQRTPSVEEDLRFIEVKSDLEEQAIAVTVYEETMKTPTVEFFYGPLPQSVSESLPDTNSELFVEALDLLDSGFIETEETISDSFTDLETDKDSKVVEVSQEFENFADPASSFPEADDEALNDSASEYFAVSDSTNLPFESSHEKKNYSSITITSKADLSDASNPVPAERQKEMIHSGLSSVTDSAVSENIDTIDAFSDPISFYPEDDEEKFTESVSEYFALPDSETTQLEFSNEENSTSKLKNEELSSDKSLSTSDQQNNLSRPLSIQESNLKIVSPDIIFEEKIMADASSKSLSDLKQTASESTKSVITEINVHSATESDLVNQELEENINTTNTFISETNQGFHSEKKLDLSTDGTLENESEKLLKSVLPSKSGKDSNESQESDLEMIIQPPKGDQSDFVSVIASKEVTQEKSTTNNVMSSMALSPQKESLESSDTFELDESIYSESTSEYFPPCTSESSNSNFESFRSSEPQFVISESKDVQDSSFTETKQPLFAETSLQSIDCIQASVASLPCESSAISSTEQNLCVGSEPDHSSEITSRVCATPLDVIEQPNIVEEAVAKELSSTISESGNNNIQCKEVSFEDKNVVNLTPEIPSVPSDIVRYLYYDDSITFEEDSCNSEDFNNLAKSTPLSNTEDTSIEISTFHSFGDNAKPETSVKNVISNSNAIEEPSKQLESEDVNKNLVSPKSENADLPSLESDITGSTEQFESMHSELEMTEQWFDLDASRSNLPSQDEFESIQESEHRTETKSVTKEDDFPCIPEMIIDKEVKMAPVESDEVTDISTHFTMTDEDSDRFSDIESDNSLNCLDEEGVFPSDKSLNENLVGSIESYLETQAIESTQFKIISEDDRENEVKENIVDIENETLAKDVEVLTQDVNGNYKELIKISKSLHEVKEDLSYQEEACDQLKVDSLSETANKTNEPCDQPKNIEPSEITPSKDVIETCDKLMGDGLDLKEPIEKALDPPKVNVKDDIPDKSKILSECCHPLQVSATVDSSTYPEKIEEICSESEEKAYDKTSEQFKVIDDGKSIESIDQQNNEFEPSFKDKSSECSIASDVSVSFASLDTSANIFSDLSQTNNSCQFSQVEETDHWIDADSKSMTERGEFLEPESKAIGISISVQDKTFCTILPIESKSSIEVQDVNDAADGVLKVTKGEKPCVPKEIHFGESEVIIPVDTVSSPSVLEETIGVEYDTSNVDKTGCFETCINNRTDIIVVHDQQLSISKHIMTTTDVHSQGMSLDIYETKETETDVSPKSVEMVPSDVDETECSLNFGSTQDTPALEEEVCSEDIVDFSALIKMNSIPERKHTESDFVSISSAEPLLSKADVISQNIISSQPGELFKGVTVGTVCENIEGFESKLDINVSEVSLESIEPSVSHIISSNVQESYVTSEKDNTGISQEIALDFDQEISEVGENVSKDELTDVSYRSLSDDSDNWFEEGSETSIEDAMDDFIPKQDDLIIRIKESSAEKLTDEVSGELVDVSGKVPIATISDQNLENLQSDENLTDNFAANVVKSADLTNLEKSVAFNECEVNSSLQYINEQIIKEDVTNESASTEKSKILPCEQNEAFVAIDEPQLVLTVQDQNRESPESNESVIDNSATNFVEPTDDLNKSANLVHESKVSNLSENLDKQASTNQDATITSTLNESSISEHNEFVSASSTLQKYSGIDPHLCSEAESSNFYSLSDDIDDTLNISTDDDFTDVPSHMTLTENSDMWSDAESISMEIDDLEQSPFLIEKDKTPTRDDCCDFRFGLEAIDKIRNETCLENERADSSVLSMYTVQSAPETEQEFVSDKGIPCFSSKAEDVLSVESVSSGYENNNYKDSSDGQVEPLQMSASDAPPGLEIKHESLDLCSPSKAEDALTFVNTTNVPNNVTNRQVEELHINTILEETKNLQECKTSQQIGDSTILATTMSDINEIHVSSAEKEPQRSVISVPQFSSNDAIIDKDIVDDVLEDLTDISTASFNTITDECEKWSDSEASDSLANYIPSFEKVPSTETTATSFITQSLNEFSGKEKALEADSSKAYFVDFKMNEESIQSELHSIQCLNEQFPIEHAMKSSTEETPSTLAIETIESVCLKVSDDHVSTDKLAEDMPIAENISLAAADVSLKTADYVVKFQQDEATIQGKRVDYTEETKSENFEDSKTKLETEESKILRSADMADVIDVESKNTEKELFETDLEIAMEVDKNANEIEISEPSTDSVIGKISVKDNVQSTVVSHSETEFNFDKVEKSEISSDSVFETISKDDYSEQVSDLETESYEELEKDNDKENKSERDSVDTAPEPMLLVDGKKLSLSMADIIESSDLNPECDIAVESQLLEHFADIKSLSEQLALVETFPAFDSETAVPKMHDATEASLCLEKTETSEDWLETETDYSLSEFEDEAVSFSGVEKPETLFTGAVEATPISEDKRNAFKTASQRSSDNTTDISVSFHTDTDYSDQVSDTCADISLQGATTENSDKWSDIEGEVAIEDVYGKALLEPDCESLNTALDIALQMESGSSKLDQNVDSTKKCLDFVQDLDFKTSTDVSDINSKALLVSQKPSDVEETKQQIYSSFKEEESIPDQKLLPDVCDLPPISFSGKKNLSECAVPSFTASGLSDEEFTNVTPLDVTTGDSDKWSDLSDDTSIEEMIDDSKSFSLKADHTSLPPSLPDQSVDVTVTATNVHFDVDNNTLELRTELKHPEQVVVSDSSLKVDRPTIQTCVSESAFRDLSIEIQSKIDSSSNLDESVNNSNIPLTETATNNMPLQTVPDSVLDVTSKSNIDSQNLDVDSVNVDEPPFESDESRAIPFSENMHESPCEDDFYENENLEDDMFLEEAEELDPNFEGHEYEDEEYPDVSEPFIINDDELVYPLQYEDWIEESFDLKEYGIEAVFSESETDVHELFMHAEDDEDIQRAIDFNINNFEETMEGTVDERTLNTDSFKTLSNNPSQSKTSDKEHDSWSTADADSIEDDLSEHDKVLSKIDELLAEDFSYEGDYYKDEDYNDDIKNYGSKEYTETLSTEMVQKIQMQGKSVPDSSTTFSIPHEIGEARDENVLGVIPEVSNEDAMLLEDSCESKQFLGTLESEALSLKKLSSDLQISDEVHKNESKSSMRETEKQNLKYNQTKNLSHLETSEDTISAIESQTQQKINLVSDKAIEKLSSEKVPTEHLLVKPSSDQSSSFTNQTHETLDCTVQVDGTVDNINTDVSLEVSASTEKTIYGQSTKAEMLKETISLKAEEKEDVFEVRRRKRPTIPASDDSSKSVDEIQVEGSVNICKTDISKEATVSTEKSTGISTKIEESKETTSLKAEIDGFEVRRRKRPSLPANDNFCKSDEEPQIEGTVNTYKIDSAKEATVSVEKSTEASTECTLKTEVTEGDSEVRRRKRPSVSANDDSSIDESRFSARRGKTERDLSSNQQPQNLRVRKRSEPQVLKEVQQPETSISIGETITTKSDIPCDEKRDVNLKEQAATSLKTKVSSSETQSSNLNISSEETTKLDFKPDIPEKSKRGSLSKMEDVSESNKGTCAVPCLPPKKSKRKSSSGSTSSYSSLSSSSESLSYESASLKSESVLAKDISVASESIPDVPARKAKLRPSFSSSRNDSSDDSSSSRRSSGSLPKDSEALNRKRTSIDEQMIKLQNEGKCTSKEKAFIAAKLIEMQFEEQDALLASRQCSSVYHAVKFLTQLCELCNCRFPINLMSSMVHCTHRACKECLKAHFTTLIYDRSIFTLLCPICHKPDITDQNIQEYFNHLDMMFRNILDGSVYDLFQRKLRDEVLTKDPNFHWCSQCSSGFIASPRLKKLYCPDCSAITCSSCHQTWELEHEGVHCERFQQWKDMHTPEPPPAGSVKFLADRGITCPSCGIVYAQASGGCIMYKCSHCSFEFCGFCIKPYKRGKDCGNKSCESLGIHAHHSLSCLFFLRDKDISEIQLLLEEESVTYLTIPPKDQIVKSRCQVREQKHAHGNISEDRCGRDIVPYCAGLCRTHYYEYLAELLRKNKIDPLPIMTTQDLQFMFRKCRISVPEKVKGETNEEFYNRLTKVVSSTLT